MRRGQPAPHAGADAAAPTEWQALDAQGQVLAQAPVVVIAAGAGSPTLLAERWPCSPCAGRCPGAAMPHLPPPAPFPANGHGNVVPSFGVGQTDDNPAEQATERGWIMGSTFERNVTELPASAPDQLAAHQGAMEQAADPDAHGRPRPGAPFRSPLAAGEQADGAAAPVEHWAAVRCTAPTACPSWGRWMPPRCPPVGVHRHGCAGADPALLCGELLAARLNGEPRRWTPNWPEHWRVSGCKNAVWTAGKLIDHQPGASYNKSLYLYLHIRSTKQ